MSSIAVSTLLGRGSLRRSVIGYLLLRSVPLSSLEVFRREATCAVHAETEALNTIAQNQMFRNPRDIANLLRRRWFATFVVLTVIAKLLCIPRRRRVKRVGLQTGHQTPTFESNDFRTVIGSDGEITPIFRQVPARGHDSGPYRSDGEHKATLTD